MTFLITEKGPGSNYGNPSLAPQASGSFARYSTRFAR